MIKVWLPHHEAYIRDNFDSMDIADIAKHLDRTSNSVRQKARSMGLISKSPEKAVGHRKLKDTHTRPPNAEETAFHCWVRQCGCAVPGCGMPASYHHEPFLSQGGNHKSGCGLCPFHHQDQKHGRHAMSRDRFNATYGIDVLDIAARNWGLYLETRK